MTKARGLAILSIVVVIVATTTLAQRYYDRQGYDDRRGVPNWQPDKEFAQDVFTFVRIRYSSGYGGRGFGGPYGRRGGRGGGRGFGPAAAVGPRTIPTAI